MLVPCRFPYGPFLLAWALGSVACDQEAARQEQAASTDESAPATEGPSPGFEFSRETKGALLTWVDDKGAFQITEAIGDIPAAAASMVRVVVDGHSPGTPTHVFVADLTGPGPSYPVRAVPRQQWEKRGLEQRRARVEELAPPPPAPEDSPSATGTDVVLYGASWCGACRQAEAYLKSKGVRLVKRDIEEDPGASTEMRAKLKKAGLGGSSIPVLDVAGTVLVGYSERAIDAALARANR